MPFHVMVGGTWLGKILDIKLTAFYGRQGENFERNSNGFNPILSLSYLTKYAGKSEITRAPVS